MIGHPTGEKLTWVNLLFDLILSYYADNLPRFWSSDRYIFLLSKLESTDRLNFVKQRLATYIPSSVLPRPLGFGKVRVFFLDSYSRFGFGGCKYLDLDPRFGFFMKSKDSDSAYAYI